MSADLKQDSQQTPEDSLRKIFTLPNDTEFINLLRQKKDQYAKRLQAKYGERLRYYPPEIGGILETTDGVFVAAREYDWYAKIMITKLEGNGTLDVNALKDELKTQQGEEIFSEISFDHASSTIEIYLGNKEFLGERVQAVANSSH
jgi:hypothetical protein